MTLLLLCLEFKYFYLTEWQSEALNDQKQLADYYGIKDSKIHERIHRMRKRVVIVSVIIFIILVVILAIPYIQVEKLTQKYGNEFEKLYNQNGFYEDIEYFKILKYKDINACMYYPNEEIERDIQQDKDSVAVLYVEENHSSCAIYIFLQDAQGWKLEKWETIWSFSGSSDGIMWPYYF